MPERTAGTDLMTIRVVLALPEAARQVSVQVPVGTTARQALLCALESGLVIDDAGIDPDSGAIGIHGRAVRDDEQVLDGDRVELYRPLRQDPMERRRRKASGAGT